jgi:hypothetical protein
MASTERFVRAYIDALDLHAICILTAASSDERVMIRFGRDVDAAVERASAKIGAPAELKATRWCSRNRDAKRIVVTCNAELARVGGGWTALIALKAVEIVAKDFGVTLQTDVSVRERAEAAVRAVELQLETMKRSGQLRAVTRAYKEYRLARAAAGQGAQPWSAWFANYKVRLVRTAAHTAAAVGRDPEIISQPVLPNCREDVGAA